jgi:hypothetical protein
MKNLEEPPDYNVETEWSREAEAMKEINKLQHPHITYGLAAFTQNQKYYLVLEWADGGNLRNFWVDNNKPQLTEAKVREFVCQLRGLSDALDKIHNSKKPSILRSRTTSAMPSPELSGTVSSSTVPEIQINGLHSSNAGMASDDAAVSESPNERKMDPQNLIDYQL